MAYGTFVGVLGTVGPFPDWGYPRTFVSEQFWGRAARASSDSKESGRLLIFLGKFAPLLLRKPATARTFP